MKDEKKIVQFSRFSRKLTVEGLLKALLVALTIGFGVVFIVAMVTWFMGMNSLALCIGIVAGVLVIGIPVSYFIFFRPTIKINARRIDRLGLEERMITMVELENDDSVLSRLQREDAQKHLAEADEKKMKILIPKKMVISVCVAVFLGCLMTTLSTLAAMGYILSGAELLDPLIPDPPVEYVYLEYIVEEGGYIEGEEFQEIILGQDGTEVIAVAEDGWVFAGWEDGTKYPNRTETRVDQDRVMIAIFEPSGEGNGEGEGGEGEGEGKPTDAPGNPSDGKGNSEEPGDENNPNAAGGKYDPANQVMDGETFYRDVYSQYADAMHEEMSEDDDGSSEDGNSKDVRDIVETYFEIIG